MNELVEKLRNNIKLTEGEIKKLRWNAEEVWEERGSNDRWTCPVSTVVNVGDDFIRIDWQKGLTESQENEFYDQPYFVKQHKYTKTIEVEEWNKI